jgi:hypothetical protein
MAWTNKIVGQMVNLGLWILFQLMVAVRCVEMWWDRER